MKKTLFFILMLILISCALMSISISSYAEIYTAEGKCGDSVNWRFCGGTLSINGSGSTYDFTDGNRPGWYYFRSDINTIEVTEGVTVLGRGFFDESSDYESAEERYCFSTLILPASLKEINSKIYSEKLDSVIYMGSSESFLLYIRESLSDRFYEDIDIYPNEIKIAVDSNVLTVSGHGKLTGSDVDSAALGELKDIHEIVIEPGINCIYDFDINLENLTAITLPETLSEIHYSFNFCTGLKEVSLPNSLKYLDNSFAYLDKIQLPRHLEYFSIGSMGSRLTNIELPSGIKEISFSNCSNLKSVTVPGSVGKIREHAFQDCTALETVVLPEGLESIGWGAFSGCYALKDINIPASVEFIGPAAFSGCQKLKTIKIPDGIDGLREAAFYGCSMDKIYLPVSVKWFDVDSLPTVNEIYYAGTEEQWNEIGSGSVYISPDCKIHFNAKY